MLCPWIGVDHVTKDDWDSVCEIIPAWTWNGTAPILRTGVTRRRWKRSVNGDVAVQSLCLRRSSAVSCCSGWSATRTRPEWCGPWSAASDWAVRSPVWCCPATTSCTCRWSCSSGTSDFAATSRAWSASRRRWRHSATCSCLCRISSTAQTQQQCQIPTVRDDDVLPANMLPYFQRESFLSVCLSVTLVHTRDPLLNGSRYRNAFCTPRKRHIYSYLRPNCVVFRVSPRMSVLKRGTYSTVVRAVR